MGVVDMGAFYHIYISPKDGVTRAQYRPKMDLAIDWFRYDDKNWIVYTTSDARKWDSRLREFVNPGGHLFICKLQIDDYFGFMSKKLWEWLKKDRQN